MVEEQVQHNGGFTWRSRPGAPPALVDRVLNLREANAGSAQVVKQNPVRTVFRLVFDGELVYVKWHRYRGIADAVKSLIRGTRAEREWKAAYALERNDITAVKPLLLGVRRKMGLPVESFLVTLGVTGVGLHAMLESFAVSSGEDNAARRMRLTRALGDLLHALHESRISHPDLHGGNLLVLEPNDELFTMDLHAVRLYRRLPQRARLQNVGFVCAAFNDPVLTATDRLRFIHAYAGTGLTRGGLRRLMDAVGVRVQRILERRVRSRSRRCMVHSSVFTNERTPQGRVYRQRTMPVEETLRAVELHRDVLAGKGAGEILAQTAHGALTAIEWGRPPGDRRLWVRRFVAGKWARLLPARLRHRAGLAAWKASLGLAVRGIAAPEALAFILGKGAESHLIMHPVEDAVPLDAWLRRMACTPPAARRKLLRAAAASWDRYFRSAIVHRRLTPEHILVRETADGPQFVLCGLEHVRFPRRAPLDRKLLNLAQLNAAALPHLSATDRLRFLRRLAENDARVADRSRISQIVEWTRRIGNAPPA